MQGWLKGQSHILKIAIMVPRKRLSRAIAGTFGPRGRRTLRARHPRGPNVKKRPNHPITCTSGEGRTQIDFVLFRKTYPKHVRDVKVIPGEEIAKQCHLLVCDFRADIHQETPLAKREMWLSTVQSRKSRDAGKPGRKVAARRDIRRPGTSPNMLSI